MGTTPLSNGRSHTTIFLSHVGAFLFLILIVTGLHRITVQADSLLHGYLLIISGLLAFVFAVLTLVRFQGTQDRISLILGAGFLLSGAVLTATSILFFQFLPEAHTRLHWAPLAWWLGRLILSLLLVLALLVERFIPRSRHPLREIVGALLTVVGLTYAIAAVFRGLPPEVVSRHPNAFFPNPEQLLPGAIFLVSLIWYRRRLSVEDSSFDRTIYAATWLNVAAQFSAAQSGRLMDAPFLFAQSLMVLSYTVALGGALLDNARLFERVHHMAVSDSLTGLANYRRLISVLEAELDRSRRTQRPFSVVLLDMDGLKTINDHYGHLTGSRAIVRLSKILRSHSRAIDTAARYGGDEFALVLPEAGTDIAARVVSRIRERLAAEAEPPALSVSAGVAAFPEDGDTPEKLLGAADRALYGMKHRSSSNVKNLTRIAACL